MNEQASESPHLQTRPTRRGTFVGRESELAALLGGLEDAIAGRSSFFLVTGEAGMGKSRLIEEATSYAEEKGVRVLSGRCWEAVDAPAYWPWTQILRHLGMDLESNVPSSGSRFAFFDSVASFIRSATEAQPMMLALEDLHAADESSLLMLQFLARQDRNASLMIIASYDEIAGRERPHHERTLLEIAREGRQLPLSGLDEDAVRQMYQSSCEQLPSDAIVRAVREASEGNPLFVDEAIRMLTTKGEIHRPDYSVGFRVPKGAGGIIRRRLEGLGDEVKELLSVASVIGREFDLTLLQSVVDIDIETLLEILGQAASADIISETSALGRYAFTHILIRETLYEDLTAAKRMRLHRTVAETLETSYESPVGGRLSELAHHWFKSAQAGDASKTMRYATGAAEHALSQHAYEEAVRLYQRALKVSEAAGATGAQIDEIRAGLRRARPSDAPSESPTAREMDAEITSAMFVREGDFWTIEYAGERTRLKDSKGLRYIVQMLKVPGREVHVHDLASMVEGDPPVTGRRLREEGDLMSDGLGDAGEILDPAAKAAYKRRLEDLREDLEEAQAFNDPEKAARAQTEIDALVDQLAAGVGLGGRDRKAASQSERARVNITKSVKDALRKIEENHVSLGGHLRATIRTGTYCSYTPDPRLAITWKTES